MAGQIAVRAYVTEARVDKLTPHLRALGGAVLEQHPAPGRKLPGCAAHQGTQALERIGAGRESPPRFVPERGSSEDRIVLRDVRRVAHQQVEALACLRTLVHGAPRHLAPEGWLLLEHGATQGADVRRELVDAGFRHVRSHGDLAGHERMTEAQR